MNDLTQIKLGFGLLFLAIILSFGLLLKKTDSLDNSQNDLQQNFVKPNDGISSIVAEKPNSLTVKLTPTPFIKQKGKVKGEISVVKFEKDLETSLKIQETPKIWLEFTDDENRAVKAELPKKAKEYVRQKWLSFFELSYQMRSAKNREDEIEIETKNLTNTAFIITELDDLQIKTPFETRRISEDEAAEIAKLVSTFALERYDELQNMEAQITTQNPY